MVIRGRAPRHPFDWVEKIHDKVCLRKSAKDAMAQWQTAA
jgi:hypothetical protein